MVSAGPDGGVEVFDKKRYGKSSEGLSWSVKENGNYMIDLTAINKSDLPLLKQDTPSSPIAATDMYDYCIFYVPQIKEGRKGDFDADIENGIYHYSIGSNKGIVKSIKFNKSDHKGLREARIEASGDRREGLYQMTDRYDATVELYGNARVIPGSSIYIDAKSFSLAMGDPWQGPEEGSSYYKDSNADDIEVSQSDLNAASPSWILGIGGYYLVQQVTSRIKSGEFDTTMKALWTDGGEMFMPPEAEDREAGDPNSPCNDYAFEGAAGSDAHPGLTGMLEFAAEGEGLSRGSPLLAQAVGEKRARQQEQVEARNATATAASTANQPSAWESTKGFFSDFGEELLN